MALEAFDLDLISSRSKIHCISMSPAVQYIPVIKRIQKWIMIIFTRFEYANKPRSILFSFRRLHSNPNRNKVNLCLALVKIWVKCLEIDFVTMWTALLILVHSAGAAGAAAAHEGIAHGSLRQITSDSVTRNKENMDGSFSIVYHAQQIEVGRDL